MTREISFQGRVQGGLRNGGWRVLPAGVFWSAFGVNAYYIEGPKGNFGDYLTHVLIEELFGYRVRKSNVAGAEIVGVGSLMNLVEDRGPHRNPWIWGTGFILDGPVYSGPRVRVAAVRGELTRGRLEEYIHGTVPLGDPGLLIGRVYPELRNIRKKYRLGVIPHCVDQSEKIVDEMTSEGGVAFINVLGHPRDVASRIAECEAVVSSSLHGLIVADALRVPNVWMPLSGRVIGGEYKFRDYYSAFGREPSPVEAGRVDSLVRKIHGTWEPIEDLEKIQDDLIEAFPAPARRRTRR